MDARRAPNIVDVVAPEPLGGPGIVGTAPHMGNKENKVDAAVESRLNKLACGTDALLRAPPSAEGRFFPAVSAREEARRKGEADVRTQ